LLKFLKNHAFKKSCNRLWTLKSYLHIFAGFLISDVNFAYRLYKKPLRTTHNKFFFYHLTPIYIFLDPIETKWKVYFTETWSLQSISIRYLNDVITISLRYFDKNRIDVIKLVVTLFIWYRLIQYLCDHYTTIIWYCIYIVEISYQYQINIATLPTYYSIYLIS
jgi:hypothetical protein